MTSYDPQSVLAELFPDDKEVFIPVANGRDRALRLERVGTADERVAYSPVVAWRSQFGAVTEAVGLTGCSKVVELPSGEVVDLTQPRSFTWKSVAACDGGHALLQKEGVALSREWLNRRREHPVVMLDVADARRVSTSLTSPRAAPTSTRALCSASPLPWTSMASTRLVTGRLTM